MYKDIVICINESESQDHTIHAAASFANQHNACLTALYVTTLDMPILPPFGPMYEENMKQAIERKDTKSEKAKESFLSIVNKLNCSATWYEVDTNENPLKAITYADLVVTSQVSYDPRMGHSNIGFINNLLLETGTPVVLIPDEWDQPILGSRIVVGWDESREVVRAVRDAMPLLQQAEHVDVVSVNYPETEGISDVSQISSYLNQRNVINQFHLQTTDNILDTPEAVLIDFVDRVAANLIVIGGYGHTRLKEIILGGTTRYLIKNSPVPVFLSH